MVCRVAEILAATSLAVVCACAPPEVGEPPVEATGAASSGGGSSSSGLVTEGGSTHASSADSGDDALDPSCRELEGDLVCVPVDFEMREIEALAIVGDADYARAHDALLDPSPDSGLIAVPFAGLTGPRAMVMLLVFDYRDSDAGPYQEFLMQTAVVDPEQPIPEPVDLLEFVQQWLVGPTPAPVAFALQHLTLGGDDPAVVSWAVEGGRRLFGYPKYYGELALEVGLAQRRLVVQQPAEQPFGVAALGAFELEAELFDALPLAPAVPMAGVFEVVTTGAGYPCWMTSRMDVGRVDARLWGVLDRLSASGGLGAHLDDLDFVPRAWLHLDDGAVQMHAEQFCEPEG